MECKFPKDSQEWKMFVEYWAMCQKHWQPEKSNDYWKALLTDCQEFVKKYNTRESGNFARELSLGLQSAMEFKWKYYKNDAS